MTDDNHEDALIAFGGAIKATAMPDGRVKLGGYLVRFGSPEQTDLIGDYFTPATDFGGATKSAVYFHHRMPMQSGEWTVPAYKERMGDADLHMDDMGVWAEIMLEMRNEYERIIADMGMKGKLGWSSGTAPHLVEVKPVGKANEITMWPLGLDASLTPTPAEPRNTVIPLKALLASDNDIEAETDAEDEPEVAIATAPVNEDDSAEAVQTDKETATMSDNPEIQAAAPATIDVQKVVEETVAATVKALREAEPAKKSAGANIAVEKDEADHKFKNLGEQLLAVKAFAQRGYEDPRLKRLGYKATGMSEGIPSDGGFLLEEGYAGLISDRMYKTGELLRRVAQDQVSPNSNSMVYFVNAETSRVNGSRYGGLQGYWVGEGGSITSSKPTFGRRRLELKKVAAVCYLTDEQLADTTWLSSYVQRTVPNELRFKVEDAIFNGAVGGPVGIMGHNALVTVTRINANEIGATDVTNMWARRWAGESDYVWLINQDATPQLNRIVLGDQPIYLPPGGLSASPYGTLLGKPVIEVEYAATLGTTGDIMLAALSQYQTIARGGVEAAESIHVQFLTDETAFRFTYRIDGQPAWAAALTPFKGTNTQSPFVVLSSTS